tara:strand:+ start:8631 stop:8864 length:234 start_codon:yes stop_codon:yes gene_type:complete
MAKNTIAFPSVETYYIIKKLNAQTNPDAYGSVFPNQRMDSGINKMKDYTNFAQWQTELAKDGVIVELDNNGNWYNVE